MIVSPALDVVVDVGGMAVRFLTTDPQLKDLLQRRYAGFLNPTASSAFEFDVSIVPPFSCPVTLRKIGPRMRSSIETKMSVSGMMSFTLKDDSPEAALRVLSSTKVFALAESLGGVESLINHPATMTHASIPREERIRNGLSDSLIRLSVGIEDVEDLVDDLKQAIG